VKVTVHVSGCDQSTAFVMNLNPSQIHLLNKIRNKLKQFHTSCAPSLDIYKGDVVEYELDTDDNWEEIPGTEKPTGRPDYNATLESIFNDQATR